MDIRDFSSYKSLNSFRSGHGLVVKLTPEQLAVAVSTLKNYDKQYNYLPNNCTTPVQDALLAAAGLGIQTGGGAKSACPRSRVSDKQLA